MKKILVIASLFIGISSFAMQDNDRQERVPPQEAISICEGKDTGSTCSVKTPRGDTLEGTCKNTPDKKYFVCMPENMENNRPPRK